MGVLWPGRRGDVVEGLSTLAAAPPALRPDQRDPRWPDLTNAVHWVVDDTWWDHRDPAEDVGTLLVDEGEAEAVALVVRAVVEVSERCGPTGSDSAWFSDPAWPGLRRAAGRAADLLRHNDERLR